MRNLIFFPSDNKNKKSAFLDNAATSLKFKSSIKSISNCYKKYPFSPHSLLDNDFHNTIRNVFSQTKQLLKDFFNFNDKDGIFFTPSSSYLLNFLALSFSKKQSSEKDSIVLTKLEHSSNVYPWISVAKETKTEIRYVEMNEDFSINEEFLLEQVDNKTKIFSFCHVSNSIGIKNDVKRISDLVKKISPECIIVVDGSQSVSSEKINVKQWGIDVFLFSCHKFYSSCGLGIVWMSKRARSFFPEIFWGGGKDFLKKNEEKIFEVGTPSTAEIFGLYQALLTIKDLNLEKLNLKRKNLRNYTINELEKIENLKIEIYNRNSSDSIILFNVLDFHSHDVANFLARNFVYVRAGNFCSPFIKELIGANSAIRVSIALYNKKSEIDVFLKVLKSISFNNII